MGIKVLIVSNLYPSEKQPYYGSFVKNFENQILKDSRVDSVRGVYIKGLHGNIIEKIISYIIFYLKIIFYTLFYKYDLIYVHLISHSTLPLRLVNCIRPLPLIFNIHGEDLLVTTSLAHFLLKHSLPLIKKSKFIVVPSHYFKQITEQYLPDYPKENILVSASGGIKDIFKPSNTLDYCHSNIRIGYLSRIDKGKGWDTMLKAVKILKNQDIRVSIILGGGGPQTPNLLHLIKELDLTDIVEFVGPIAHDELPPFYQSLDLFIFPTELRESLGLVGLEAMACGIPVVGSNIGGLKDYIKNGQNGFFFEPGDPKDLADKIQNFLVLNKEEKNKLKEGAVITASLYEEKTVSQNLFDTIFNQ